MPFPAAPEPGGMKENPVKRTAGTGLVSLGMCAPGAKPSLKNARPGNAAVTQSAPSLPHDIRRNFSTARAVKHRKGKVWGPGKGLRMWHSVLWAGWRGGHRAQLGLGDPGGIFQLEQLWDLCPPQGPFPKARTHVILAEAALPVPVGLQHHLGRLGFADGHEPRLHGRESLREQRGLSSATPGAAAPLSPSRLSRYRGSRLLCLRHPAPCCARPGGTEGLSPQGAARPDPTVAPSRLCHLSRCAGPSRW